jgi:hypothetical protein
MVRFTQGKARLLSLISEHEFGLFGTARPDAGRAGEAVTYLAEICLVTSSRRQPHIKMFKDYTCNPSIDGYAYNCNQSNETLASDIGHGMGNHEPALGSVAGHGFGNH